MKNNKPVRMSKEVKDILKMIKDRDEMKSMDAVLKKLLKKGGDY